MRRGVRAFGAVVFWAVAASRCASRATPRPPGPPPMRDPDRAFSRWEEAEPALLALEDRRAFDAPALAAAARSPSAPIRARGALALGRIGDERAADPLRRLLSDPSGDVRTAAAFAAGILGEPGLSADLVPLLGDPDEGVAQRAAWSLGWLEQPVGQDALIAGVAEAPTPERKAACLRALWHFTTAPAAAAALPFTTDPDTRIRASALYALARRPQETSLPWLTAGLADPDADTAAVCARALGLLGKPESIGPLAAAASSPRAPVAIFGMMALASVLEKNPEQLLPVANTPRLLQLSGDADPNLAIPALRLLRWLTADREVFRRLWSVASTGMQRRQQVALQALMAGIGAGAEGLVDAAIESPDPYLRAAVAEALGSLPEAGAAPRRARLAADPEVLVRQKVLSGLSTADAVRGSRALIDTALADPDAGVRAAAVEALGQLDEPATLPILQQAVAKSTGDREPDVPIAAMGVAEKSPERPEARAVLETAYRHPSTLVSRLARRSLVQVFHANPAALPWREYVTGRDTAAYEALGRQTQEGATVVVETERGTFSMRLAPAEATMTVANFLRLAKESFFDGARIHRVVPGYVVQDGDPSGTGNGGPGYEIRDELNAIPYATGTVGMALAGPDTGGSQWFITQSPQPHLDGRYTVFGQVIGGFDVVRRIEQGDRILRVTVRRTGAP